MTIAGLVVCALVAASCVPRVSIRSTKSPELLKPLEPVTFIVHEGNFGPGYTKPLKIALEDQLRAARIDGHAWVITGAEYNEEAILRYWASRSKAIVLMLPAGGTSYYGGLIQVLYDVRVLEIQSPKYAKTVWRARTSAGSGAVENWIETLATDLVEQLVADGVLPRRERKS